VLHFDSVPTDGSYWILDLGPVVDGHYDYSIISDSKNILLYVLARDVDRFKSNYEADVLAKLSTLGFTGPKKPTESYQGADCVYESTLRQRHIQKMAEFQAIMKTL
jgi:hypothetical protein